VDVGIEVIIVGGGPAGLSAALVLGGACREVLLIDDGRPRNAASRAIHGFLTREGIMPAELRRLGREQLARFPNVRIADDHVIDVSLRPGGGFEVRTAGGGISACRKVIIATGVIDNVPDVPGFAEYYGRGLFHCPFCDGWDVRAQPLAAYGSGARGAGLALELLNWSVDVVLCTDGPADLPPDQATTLARNDVLVIQERVVAFRGDGERLREIAFEARPPLPRAAAFFSLGQHPTSPLAQSLGCQINQKGTVDTARHESTNVPGVYVVGDASRNLQWVALAAAEGAEAAFAVTQALIAENLR
jgi:thioredoxin reductase